MKFVIIYVNFPGLPHSLQVPNVPTATAEPVLCVLVLLRKLILLKTTQSKRNALLLMTLGKHNIPSGICCILRRELPGFLTPDGWGNKHYTSNCLLREHFFPSNPAIPQHTSHSSWPGTFCGPGRYGPSLANRCSALRWARAQDQSRDVGA